MRSLFVVGLFAIAQLPLSIPGSAQAQTYGAFDMGMLTNTLAQDHVTRSQRSRVRAPQASPSTGVSGMRQLSQALSLQARAPSNTAPDVDSRYTATQAVREKLAGIMSEAAEKQGAAEAAEMRKLVLSKAALNQYVRVAPSLGYRADDAVDALAFYMLAQWGVANDHRADVTRVQAAAVRRQAANAYAEVTDQLGTDALRQEFAEMLVIQGAIMAGTHEAAVRSGDTQALRRYADLARQGGKILFTMDPTTIQLTDDGFRQIG